MCWTRSGDLVFPRSPWPWKRILPLRFIDMKNFQRNLFILLAVALCGTCAYQWFVQGNQAAEIQRENKSVFDQGTEIQSLTNSLKLRDDQIKMLTDRVTALKQTMATNDQQMIEQKRE